MALCQVDGFIEDGLVEYTKQYRVYLLHAAVESEEPLHNTIKIVPPVIVNSKKWIHAGLA